MRSLIVATLLALSLPACGGAAEREEPAACPAPEAVDDLSLLPADIPLDQWGVVSEIEVEKGFLGATAVTQTQIVELYPVLARAVVDAGYEILSGDNEGFEAEIFFVRGHDTNGTFRLREGPCGDQVTIKLLYGAERYRRAS